MAHRAQTCFRLDRRLKARIQELVAGGEYRSASEFVNQAILQKFAFERIPVDGEIPACDPIADYFASCDGRRLIRKLVREAQAE